MSKREMVKLGDVCEILSGYAFDSQLFIDNHNCGMPLIRIRDIVRGFTQTYTTEKYDEKYIIKSGDLLIGMDGEFNIALWKNENALLNQRVCKIKSISSNRLSEKYLFYFMPKALKQIEQSTSFVTVKHLSVKTIYQIEIPLPPLDVQNKIANTLDKAQEIIDGHKKQLGELDSLIKAIFYDMFGDPITNERGWKLEELRSLGELGRGVSKHRPRNAPDLLGGKYPFIQTGDVANSDLYITKYINTYSELGFKQSKMWEQGTLCITIAANIAKTAILNFDACFPDSVVGFCSNSNTNNIFIHYWFGFFQSILEAQAPESAQKNINLRILNELKIIVPPIDLQNKFETIVNNIEEQKAIVRKSIEESENLFNSLMNKYFE